MREEYKKAWYLRNRERILKERKEYRLNNVETIKEYDRIRGKIRRSDPAYKEKHKILHKKWFLKNRDKVNLRRRNGRVLKPRVFKTKEELIQKARIRHRRYYYKNKTRLLKEQAIKNQTRIKSDPHHRIMVRMRFRLWHALKYQGINKSEKTLEMIGCSKSELISYIEKKFKPGMTWENYGRGGWTIDHIIPVSKVDLSIEHERNRVFNYKNLQPLWEIENIKKGNKL